MLASTSLPSRKARQFIASKRKEIAALDDEFFGEVVGVAQAIGALRKALNEVSASLDRRQFEKASALGYQQVAMEFVFLQRTLGGLQTACLNKERLVSELALKLHCSYESVLPQVDGLMKSTRPISKEQRGAGKKRRSQLHAAIEAVTRRAGPSNSRGRGSSAKSRGGKRTANQRQRGIAP